MSQTEPETGLRKFLRAYDTHPLVNTGRILIGIAGIFYGGSELPQLFNNIPGDENYGRLLVGALLATRLLKGGIGIAQPYIQRRVQK